MININPLFQNSSKSIYISLFIRIKICFGVLNFLKKTCSKYSIIIIKIQ